MAIYTICGARRGLWRRSARRAHTSETAAGQPVLRIKRDDALQGSALLEACLGDGGQRKPYLRQIGLLRRQGAQKGAGSRRVAFSARPRRALQ
jgi:hypothetical protein